MTHLTSLLNQYRSLSQSEREKGDYFEQLIICYLRNEASYRDLYAKVGKYGEWAKEKGLSAQDAGIDLVAETHTGEVHAIQCKLYAADYRLQKSDIDSFFTASGKKPFAHRIIVSTTTHWSHHAEDALVDQQPPVSRIDLSDLESSQIDWTRYHPQKPVALKPKKKPRPHQQDARSQVISGLKTHDRGKLIMACGTGKTFTALKISEDQAGKNGRVLFLVPSLSLLSQTLTEWTQESEVPLHCFAVCSDSDVGKKRAGAEDEVRVLTHELRYPATTDAKSLAQAVRLRHDKAHMSVVFSTYHSIDVISQAQKKHDLEAFDLIICDEAHRTTGATFADQDESNFVKVHEAKFIRSVKRLYMTATPRVYGDVAKASAEKDSVALCSMDDESLYGPQLYVLTFSEAVRRQLLVDYKVVVLAVEEAHVSRRLQSLLADENNQLKVDDAAKIVGCWKALAKQGIKGELVGDGDAMRRAVAFCQVIEPSKNGKVHKVSSKNIAAMFQAVVEAYQEKEEQDQPARLKCEAEHVDGSMNAGQKEEKLTWLKAEAEENTCRILSNVRCLSEGVDVPALDAVLFLTPRNSQVDVVQSVGRVMRNAPGKKRGYVILPVVIPAGIEPHAALNDNKTYAVVWQVLQALRSHDDRFDALINKIDLDLNKNILSKMEVVAVTDKIAQKAPRKPGKKDPAQSAKGGSSIGKAAPAQDRVETVEMEFEIGEIERAIYAKVVQKCGNRHHWEDWANDIAKIARTHIDRIKGILETPSNTRERKAFDRFACELREDLNDSITDADIVEMLAQHLITKPVFDALFAGYSFAKYNPMSKAMQAVLDALHEHHLEKETDTLERFYGSVRERAEDIESATGKQKIVVELYDKFFRNAFPKMTERLGIVYTPVEVVDFILHSVNHLLKVEFGQTLGRPGVHILDPFTGTGTFITRLLQSGLITPDELTHKYKHEIHANEIILLAYYIAAINIESVYHSLAGGSYSPFEGICLTDTFQLYEREDINIFPNLDNSARRSRQKRLDIRVILGNPPYSAGQSSANDNNTNVEYPHLDERIRLTYAERSEATNKNALYDSYIRAIRWASDRVGSSGIIGFVTNAGFVEANTAAGMRKCLAEEFSNVYIFHLRGNQRTQGELSKKEGGKIFGSGSRAPIAISFLVKNPTAKVHGRIHFHDVGDYLTREEKLKKIVDFGSIAGIEAVGGWREIAPDEHGDWLKQRDDRFAEFIALGDKDGESKKLFGVYSCGVKTQRDAWCYNFSHEALTANMKRLISFYNSEVERLGKTHKDLNRKDLEKIIDSFVNPDTTKISWTRALKQDLVKGKKFEFDPDCIVQGLYRPFCRQWLYFNRRFNEMVYQMPRIFRQPAGKNLVIGVSSPSDRLNFSALMTDTIPSLHAVDMVGSHYFPLYTYEEPRAEESNDLFKASEEPKIQRKEAITQEGLGHFQASFPGLKITREDLFYYIYGLLHSPEYRAQFSDNLVKELPRIPCVKSESDFKRFSEAGRALGGLHVEYEKAKPYPVRLETSAPERGTLPPASFRVEKMRYGTRKEEGRTVEDKSTLIYNEHITVRDIPLEAYSYMVNGKAALDWIVERYSVRMDRDSGIENDANAWATATAGNPAYPLELFQRVITVSLETLKIIQGLPSLSV